MEDVYGWHATEKYTITLKVNNEVSAILTQGDSEPINFYMDGEDEYEFTYYAKNSEGFVSDNVTGHGTADTMGKWK